MGDTMALIEQSEADVSLVADDISTEIGGGNLLLHNVLQSNQYTLISLCTNGTVSGEIDGKPVSMSRNDMLFVLPGHKVETSSFSSDYRATHLLISRELSSKLWQNSTIDIQLRTLNDFVSHLTPDETTAMLHALGMLEYLIATPSSKQMENVTRVMLMMMLLFTGLKDHHPISPTYSSMHQRQLFERFHDLVQHNHRRTRKIADYAEMMCLSAKYLSTMVKQLTGRSASAWIDDCLLDSAKMALASESKLTIQQIAISMGFVDQATFSKWFKRKHGLTPSQYRLLN